MKLIVWKDQSYNEIDVDQVWLSRVFTPQQQDELERGKVVTTKVANYKWGEYPRLTIVTAFSNGMVAVFDQYGRQMPEYQGRKKDVWDKILRDKLPTTKFEGELDD